MAPESLRAALGLLTVVPAQAPLGRPPVQALAWFPGVGLLLGGMLAGIDALLGARLPAPLGAFGLVLALVVLTGGLHLDGLSDTVDGLLGGREPRHRLRVMQDSRLGAFAAVALWAVLTGKVLALWSLPPGARMEALILAPVLARTAMVWMLALGPPARTEGMAAPLIQDLQKQGRWIPWGVALQGGLVAGGVAGWMGVGCFLGVALATWGVVWGLRRLLGGVTGDTVGAWGEVLEWGIWSLWAVLEAIQKP